MSQMEVILPQHVEPTCTIIMPSILGGCLTTKEGQTGDLYQRAQWTANDLGAAVIAIERTPYEEVRKRDHFLGLPKARDIDDYVLSVRDDVREVSEKIEDEALPSTLIGLGASAGATHLAKMAVVGMDFDKLSLYDPTAMDHQSRGTAFLRWAKYQMFLQMGSGKELDRNQNPLDHSAAGEVSPLADMSLHGRIWTSLETFLDLHRVANGTASHSATTRLYIPLQTFTQSPERAEVTTKKLNFLAAQTGTDFRAEMVSYSHRFTDDPARVARLGHIILEEPGSYLT